MAWSAGAAGLTGAGASAARTGELELSEVSRHFVGGSGISLHWLLIGAGFLLMVISAASLRVWWATRHTRSSPLWVFNRVAYECGLSLGDRVFLWRIARRQALPPLALLLSPTTLRHHARAYADSRGAAGRTAVMRRAAALRRRVFG